MKKYSVYIMTNGHNNVLYIGVTGNLERRVWEHKNGQGGAFSTKYNCVKLVYYEDYSTMKAAIQREKNLKDWKREWKENIVIEQNPDWKDISEEWE